MKIITKAVTTVLILSISSVAHASLLGESFDGDYGINNSGGPFDAGFTEQSDGGVATVGAGVEYTSFFGPDIDITDTGAVFTGFSSGASLLPFNGWRFVLQNPTVQITGLTLVSTTVAGLDSSNLAFDATGFAVNSEASMLGDLEVAITTSPVPEPKGLHLLMGVAALFVLRRKRLA